MDQNLRRWIALVVVCLGQLMIMVDSTIVNVALPSIQRDLGFTPANLTWVVNSYLIAYGAFLLVAGRAGDLIGRRKVFLAGVLLFTAASVASGLSHGVGGLVAGRFLQGLGGSLSGGVIIALIVTGFPKPAERAQAMSVFTFVIAGGGSLGLLAGGVLTQWVNWHWIFFINVPIGVATLALGWWLIEENRGLGLSHGVDITGAILITAALMLGVYAIVTAGDQGWTSAHTLGFGGLALVLVAAFVWVQTRLRNPLMPLRILRLRSLTGASVARAFLVAGMFTNFFVGALYLQHVKGFSSFTTGLAFLPTTLTLASLSAGITAWLMHRYGPRNLLLVGLITIGTGLLILAGADAQADYFPRIFAAYILLGLGAGTSFMPLLTIAMSEVPVADAGLASGFGNVTMQIGGAIGLASLGTISTAHTGALIAQGNTLRSALAGGYQLAFLLAAMSVAIALVVALTVLRSSHGRRQTEPAAAREEAEPEAA
ncbi:MAG: MFS transporter [Chloroflexi bacterium]|nr:MAG: MFS transporter [Chloroflexota bacterium]